MQNKNCKCTGKRFNKDSSPAFPRNPFSERLLKHSHERVFQNGVRKTPYMPRQDIGYYGGERVKSLQRDVFCLNSLIGWPIMQCLVWIGPVLESKTVHHFPMWA